MTDFLKILVTKKAITCKLLQKHIFLYLYVSHNNNKVFLLSKHTWKREHL